MFGNKKNNASLPGSMGQSNNKEKIVGSSPAMTFGNKIFIAITVLLAILYFLSYTKSCTSGDRREKIKSALVNQKYKDDIIFFELSDASGSITIT